MNKKKITNAELIVLCLASEGGSTTGYDLSRKVNMRGYRGWAGISTTSIYTSLKKLEQHGFLASQIMSEKSGKGPLPRLFSLTESGVERLKSEIRRALSEIDDGPGRFDIALSVLPLLDPKEVLDGLKKRRAELSRRGEEVHRKYLQQGGAELPIHVRAIFQHGIEQLEFETDFAESLIRELEAEKE